MAQSSIYKRGSSTAQTVDVTSDSARDLGNVAVSQLNDNEFDVTDDGTRQLGRTTVTNTVGTEVENTVETLLAAALGANADDYIRIDSANALDVSASTVPITPTDPTQVNDSSGTTVDPAQSGPQGNWPGGYDKEFTPGDTTVTQLPAGPVPDGVEVVVQAHPENSEPVHIGLSNSPVITRPPGEGYTAKVSDRSNIRVQTQTAGDSVNISHEAN